MLKLSDQIERKFTEVIDTDEWEILTDSGWSPIVSSNKTIPYAVWKVSLVNGYELYCADNHILFNENFEEVFAEDLTSDSFIITDVGPIKVETAINLNRAEEMYDLSISSDTHRFYTNGILSHNSTTSVGYILWYILFNEAKPVAILANKGATARVILAKLQVAYEQLPLWLQGGVVSWNKGSIEIGNRSQVFAGSTTSSAIRGSSISLLFLDEYAFINPRAATEFFRSVYPTISSGKETKICVVSTPNGMNHFYKMWVEAIEGRSDFKPIEINWDDIPGRDEEWKARTIANTSQESFDQEFAAEFLGSSNTLIEGRYLKDLIFKVPLQTVDHLNIFTQPIQNHLYVLVGDCSEGVGGDATALSIIDITEFPYKQVATFRHNKTPVLLMPDIIVKLAKKYNDANVLLEVNSSGNEIANLIRYELDYENLLTVGQDKKGQILMGGATATRTPGLRTTKSSKRIGCTNLKDLVENKKLDIVDFDTISELATFIRHANGSFSADDTCNDDTIAALLVFAWMSNQPYFESLKDTNLRKELHEERIMQFEKEAMPVIFSTQREEEKEEVLVDEKGIHWTVVNDIPWYDPFS